MQPECDDFPALVYEYDAQGYYSEPLEVKTFDEMKDWMMANLVKIIQEKRELRITDKLDRLMFHVQEGKILFDGECHYSDGKPI